jgi:hypothetical protein
MLNSGHFAQHNLKNTGIKMSKIDELNTRPPTHVYTTRVDIRYLATLIRFWHSRGELPRSISELNRLSLETFIELLVQNHKVDMVDLINDAEEIIQRTGFNLRKIPRNITEALIKENFELEPVSPIIDASHKRTRLERPVSSMDTKRAQTILESTLQTDLEQRIKDEQARTEEFRCQLANPDFSDEQGNS